MTEFEKQVLLNQCTIMDTLANNLIKQGGDAKFLLDCLRVSQNILVKAMENK